ncbi:hypothetical protein HPP92_014851 [Vanilla planifolia]|uniref:Uncharacterized protein n=1 Tax=Vanilla planifolia TaxID=51239 RepID=A0A835QPB0_VANPL|nr:hypothetical protein HPP92_015331 [Vanilla planifolia]KAG0475165.1 hypothetical protein HPP92_014851 [Vanilla planifolia]
MTILLRFDLVEVDVIMTAVIEGTSKLAEDVDGELTPLDLDMNLVQSFLDSFTSQQGLPGPASNLLGLMGIKLPADRKDA